MVVKCNADCEWADTHGLCALRFIQLDSEGKCAMFKAWPPVPDSNDNEHMETEWQQ